MPDQIQLDGSTFHDAETHPTEQLTATQILAQSSNIGTSEIAQRPRGEPAAGPGEGTSASAGATGLDFPGEERRAHRRPPQQWEPTDYVSLPIGQVDAVTAQQVLDAYNAVANGGVMVQPRLVQATVAAGGTRQPAAPRPATG